MRETVHSEPPFDSTQALREAARCLQCFDAPCTQACPVGIVIPRFIRMIRSGNLRGAAEVVRSANPMALSCGVACPDEQLCAAACLRAAIDAPIAIRRLHRFANDHEEASGPKPPQLSPHTGGRVAVVGGGPSGLACAFELRRRGVAVTLFEGRDRLGGVLSSTIPLYRFSEETVRRDACWTTGLDDAAAGWASVAGWRVDVEGRPCVAGQSAASGGELRAAGRSAPVEVKLKTAVGEVVSLARAYDAVYLAPGLVMHDPGIPGSDLRGVTTATEFLGRCRKSRYRISPGGRVVVIGGGNVAVDAAMAAIRCGEVRGGSIPSVTILYRRSREEMPAWQREVRDAERVGVRIQFLAIPVALEGIRGRLRAVRLCRAELGTADASGRRAAVPVSGGEFTIPSDMAILATGMRLDRRPLGDLPVTRGGLIKVESGTRRVRANIFAGGDIASVEQTIVAAVRDGKLAARAIAGFLAQGRKPR